MSEEKQLLIDADTYLKSGAHIGTKNKSGEMKRYIFKLRPDGLSVMDVQVLDDKIRLAAKMIAQYNTDKVACVGRRLYAKTPLIRFAAAIIRVPVIAFCSTNNTTRDVDLVIPINNKGRRSLALGYWLLAREVLKEKGIMKNDSEFKQTIDDFEYQIKEEEKRAEERRRAIQKMERRRKNRKKER